MTRFFMDTEFIEDGKTIELISIAIVPLVDENDPVPAGFYAISSEYKAERAGDWVKQNVIAKLPTTVKPMSRKKIRDNVLAFIRGYPPPYEFWAYFADYDWVVFCQLFGKMIDLPKGIPQFCMDVKQEMVRLGVTRDQLPVNDNEHDAFCDAFWTRDVWLWLRRHYG